MQQPLNLIQNDPIYAYIFIMTLEVLFLFIRKHPKIKGIEIFERCFLYTADADDATFFLKDSQSIAYLVELSNTFFRFFSGLKPNLIQCEIAGTGALIAVQLAACGMKCIDLRNEALNISGTYFSNNITIKESNFLKVVSNLKALLKLWQFQNVTLEKRIIVFKSLLFGARFHESTSGGLLLQTEYSLYIYFSLNTFSTLYVRP